MTVAAIIVQGVGPGSTKTFLLTGGLGIGSGALPMAANLAGVETLTGNLVAPTIAAALTGTGTLAGTLTAAIDGVPGGGGRVRYTDVPDTRRAHWKKKREREEALVAEITEIYERVVEGKKPAETKAVAAVIAPYVDPGSRAVPQAAEIDFERLAEDVSELKRLAKALADKRAKAIALEIEIERDDEEVIEAFMRMIH